MRLLQRSFLVFFFIVSAFVFVLFSCGTQDTTQPAWKFAVICDTRGNNDTTEVGKICVNATVVASIAADVVSQGCELVIFPGDLVNGWWANGGTSYEAQFNNWKEAMAEIYDAGIEVYPVRGNHENGPGNWPFPPYPPVYPMPNPPVASEELEAAFKAAFPGLPSNGPVNEKGLTYSFNHKNAFFVGLDTYVDPFKIDQSWFNAQLVSSSQPHIFVYGHAPAFIVDHTDTLAYYPDDRDAFWDSLGTAGARIYFCGHDHFYNRLHVADSSGNDIYQALVGSGGAPFSSWSGTYPEGSKVIEDYYDPTNYGYAVVTVDGSLVTYEWRALTAEAGSNVWKTLDTFSYTF